MEHFEVDWRILEHLGVSQNTLDQTGTSLSKVEHLGANYIENFGTDFGVSWSTLEKINLKNTAFAKMDGK